MTSQSAIFDCRVNPIAPVEASLKCISIKYNLETWKFLLLTGEIVENVYKPIRKQQIEISKYVIFHAVILKGSLSVSEIMANLY